MRVIIAGSRSIDSDYYPEIESILDNLRSNKIKITTIISGAAKGVDSLAIRYAKENHIPFEIYEPDWSLGKSAGVQRNMLMAKNADALICFWDGTSKGSKNMLEIMKKLKKRLVVLTPDSSGEFSELFRNF